MSISPMVSFWASSPLSFSFSCFIIICISRNIQKGCLTKKVNVKKHVKNIKRKFYVSKLEQNGNDAKGT